MPKRLADGSIRLDVRFRGNEAAHSALKACEDFVSRSRLLRWCLTWAIEQHNIDGRVISPVVPSIHRDPQLDLSTERPIRIRLAISPGEVGYSQLSALPEVGDSRVLFLKRHVESALAAQMSKHAGHPEVADKVTPQVIDESPALASPTEEHPAKEFERTDIRPSESTRLPPKGLGSVLD